MREALLPLVALSLAAVASAADRPVGRDFADRSVVYARHGMVATAHPLATEAGLEVLRRGGSAVDAAIAANAALSFLEPMSCGLGGDLFALVWDPKTGTLHGYNGSGRSPAALTIDKVPAEADGTIPVFSPYAWSVPGVVDGWFALHDRFGALPMKAVLSPAAAMAREGAPVPEVIAAAWAGEARELADKPGFADVFLPGGHAPHEGEIFANPALARALELLAADGREAYYKGEIATRIVAFSEAHGGFFSRSDFASHRGEWVEPISTTYRGTTVWELPPNGQGLAALEMLNILENYDLAALGRGSADFWHLLVEAKKLAFEDRARYYADPAMADVPVELLLSKEHGKALAARIDMEKAARTIDTGTPRLDHGDTTFLVVADATGQLVSLIQSNYAGFGSGYVVPELGFPLQNRGCLFNLDPDHPNALQPGKRPFHTIIPAMLGPEGVPTTAFGVMGGSMQPQGHVQIVINLVDFAMNLQEAGDAPRFRHIGSSQPTGTVMTNGGVVMFESGVPLEIQRDLAGRGHRLGSPVGMSFGGYQAITRDPTTGVLAGATESRKDGCASGY